MAKFKHFDDTILLRILNQLPLRKVLQLRRVNSHWKTLIEMDICKKKTSLKIFGSLKAVLDYYQLVNREYHQIDGPAVALTSLAEPTLEVKGIGSCNRIGCACRRPLKWELVKNFRLHLPGGADHFPNFTLPSDDHLVAFRFSERIINTLLQLFPSLEHLVIFHVANFSERYFRLPFSLHKLKHLELYDRHSNPNDLSAKESELQNMLSQRISRRHQASDAITAPYRTPYTHLLVHLEELTLDGAFFSKFYLWEMLLEAEDSVQVRRLTIYRFTEDQLLSKRAKKAIATATIRKQLTHLTVDSVTFGVLEFLVNNFDQLEFLDIVVERGLKSYDLLATIFNLRNLTELRLHCTDPNFFSPVKLNYIFAPNTFPAVTKLHLYLAQLTHEKLELLTKRIFPTVQALVIDSGLLSCPCESDFLKRIMQSYYRNKSALYRKKFLLNSACSKCVAGLPSALLPGIKLHFYDGCRVIDTFFRLNQRFYSTHVRRMLKGHNNYSLESESEATTSAPTNTPTTSPIRQHRLSVYQRIRNGLRRGLGRVSTRRRRVTTIDALHSTLAMQRPSTAGFSYFDWSNHEDVAHNQLNGLDDLLTDNEIRTLMRVREFEWDDLEDEEPEEVVDEEEEDDVDFENDDEQDTLRVWRV